MTSLAASKRERELHLEVRTPHQAIFDEPVLSVRFPVESGHAGLRPGAEATALAVEAGLIWVRLAGGRRYFGSPGGLLRCDGRKVVLLTPFCVAGDSPDDVVKRLEAALQAPDAEMEARKTLEKLEEKIIRDLRPGVARRVDAPGQPRRS